MLSSVGHVGSVSIILLVSTLLLLRKRIFAVLIMFLFYSGQGVEFVLKKILHQPGPPFQFHRIGEGVFFDKDYIVPGSSYPSGHSFRAVFTAIVITYIMYKKYGLTNKTLLTGLVLGGLAFAIMTAKIVLGEHWSSDIAGGALLGAATAFFAILFIP